MKTCSIITARCDGCDAMSMIEQRDLPARGEGTMKTLWIDGKGEPEILAAGATGAINLIEDIMCLREDIAELKAALAAVKSD